MGSVSEVWKFFIHGKRQDKLEEVIETQYKDISRKKVSEAFVQNKMGGET